MSQLPMNLDVPALVAEFLKSHLDSLLHGATSGARRVTSAVRENLERTYASYLQGLLHEANETKSFVIRDRPVQLSQIYIPLDLTGPFERYASVGMPELSEVYRPTLILGSAGTGKSLLMRHLAMDAIASCSYVPILVELRHLSNYNISLRQLIYKKAKELGLKLSEEEFSRVMTSGKLALFLDGFDEVPLQKRSSVTLEIFELTSALYLKTPIIVSSRPERQLEAWPHFRNLSICPLSLEGAVNLVVHLPIDREIKGAFVRELRSGLFEERFTFASNPLLLSIMILTFSANAYIPLKRSLFLDKAFDVLFEQHDALKPAFRRERTSGLDIDEFEKLFSAFSLLSYDDERARFPESYARQLVKESTQTTGIAVEPEAFVHDAIQAISLLVRDGLELAYTHRSFQEYFVAKFIVDQADSSFRAELLDCFLRRAETDEVLDLAFEINPRLIERDYLISRSLGIKFLFDEGQEAGEGTLREFYRWIGLKIFVRVSAVTSDRSSGPQCGYTVGQREHLKMCDLLVRLYHSREHSFAVDISEPILQTWRELDLKKSVEWTFDSDFPPTLLARLGKSGEIFSLARLRLVEIALQQMDRSVGREATARDLLGTRRKLKPIV